MCTHLFLFFGGSSADFFDFDFDTPKPSCVASPAYVEVFVYPYVGVSVFVYAHVLEIYAHGCKQTRAYPCDRTCERSLPPPASCGRVIVIATEVNAGQHAVPRVARSSPARGAAAAGLGAIAILILIITAIAIAIAVGVNAIHINRCFVLFVGLI